MFQTPTFWRLDHYHGFNFDPVKGFESGGEIVWLCLNFIR